MKEHIFREYEGNPSTSTRSTAQTKCMSMKEWSEVQWFQQEPSTASRGLLYNPPERRKPKKDQ